MDFFCFSTCSFFFHFIAVGFRPSGLGFDGFFCFSTCNFFFHFIALGLRHSGSGFDSCFFFFSLAASFSILLLLVYGRRV